MVYFITENYLKNYTGYNNNIDMSKTEYLIRLSYDIYIVELLGTYFSNSLLEKHQLVLTNSYTYTPKEEKLVDFIQSAIAWIVNYQSVIELSDQLTNKGPIKQSGDFQQPTSDTSAKFKASNYFSNFEKYKIKMTDYLCKYKSDFPDFLDDLNDDSLVKDKCVSCKSIDLEDDGLFFV